MTDRIAIERATNPDPEAAAVHDLLIAATRVWEFFHHVRESGVGPSLEQFGAIVNELTQAAERIYPTIAGEPRGESKRRLVLAALEELDGAFGYRKQLRERVRGARFGWLVGALLSDQVVRIVEGVVVDLVVGVLNSASGWWGPMRPGEEPRPATHDLLWVPPAPIADPAP
jgi:hypothetical protein